MHAFEYGNGKVCRTVATAIRYLGVDQNQSQDANEVGLLRRSHAQVERCKCARRPDVTLSLCEFLLTAIAIRKCHLLVIKIFWREPSVRIQGIGCTQLAI